MTEAQRKEFPVRFDDPADAERTWRYDDEHTPGAVEPLSFDCGIGPFVDGFGWGANPRFVNYYAYYAWSIPGGGASTAEPAAASREDLEKIRAAGARWDVEVLPEVLGLIDRFRTTNFAALTDDELAAEIERLPEMRFRSGRLHTLSVTPPFMAMTALVNTYRAFTGGDELGALRLVQGHGNKSVEAGEALWRLSRLAADIPIVRERVLALEDRAVPRMLAELRTHDEALPFLDALDAFLDEYGWRSGGSLCRETWIEDPAVALAMLRAYVETEGYDPVAERARLNEEREAAIADATAQLDADAKAHLQLAIDVAKECLHLTEDHNYFIDQRLYTMPRRLILEGGKRLAGAGAVDAPQDVFFLHVGEYVDALRAQKDGLADLIATRKQEFERFSAMTPPSWIGAPPPEGAAAPRARAAERAGELRGMGASAGVARGPVRVVRTLAEAGRLRPGDVLVTHVTLPPWTPLFAVACAVVTEVGGMLGHTATVAREYRMPAVLAVEGVTTQLSDGQLVEVDGAAGVVRVLA